MTDEYIRKQDAVDVASEDGKKIPTVVIRIMHDIKALPAADVAPVRHGKWIFVHPLSSDDGGAYLCSECEKGDWDIKPSDKFCKFCGAKMDRKEEEEE